MTKEDALNKLKILINQLSQIQGYSSGEFNKWKMRSERYIKEIFNDDSYNNKLFNVRYLPISMMFGESTNSEKIEAFESGKKLAINILESFYEEVEEWKDNITENVIPTQNSQIPTVISNKVFIVHGHDNGAKQEVARFLEKLGLEPIILHEQASGQRTIIEKIEEYTGQVGFGVVLYTECDVGGKDKDCLQSRARQNVVFEHGYLIGLLGRNRVCPLVKGKVETPGDISGVVYTPMDDNGSWHLPLVKELKAAGYDIDSNKLI